MEPEENLTSVQWLVKKLDLRESIYLNTHKIIDQALQMEREQIKKAFYNGSFQITENELEYRKTCANNYYVLTYNIK